HTSCFSLLSLIAIQLKNATRSDLLWAECIITVCHLAACVLPSHSQDQSSSHETINMQNLKKNK
ncbi:unnamed protein product, partial [Ceratitis capitata]